MTWDDIIEKSDSEHFIGREQELLSFRSHLERKPPRYLIFYITGQGGVGKTTFLNRCREVAEDSGFLILDSDERQRDIPTILGRFSQQLALQGFSMKHFDERYKAYRQQIDEIERDPKAPQGIAALVGKTLIRGVYVAGDLVPGIRKGLEYIPKDVAEEHASEWAIYLSTRFSNKDEIALIKDPISVLTPIFIQDINHVADKKRIVICFENFEETRGYIQDWISGLREYKLSHNVRLIIASRTLPGPKWDTIRSVTLAYPLDVFSPTEAEQFLDVYGIKDPKRRADILDSSGRLPVLMSWLSATEGIESDNIMPSGDIVERFLRWVPDPALRRVALLASIPRSINLDILKLILSSSDSDQDNEDVTVQGYFLRLDNAHR